MSSEEKKKILQMVEDGTISAEEAMSLIKALEETPAEAEMELIEPKADYGGGRGAGLEFEEVKARAKKFAMIPLGIGIVLTVLGAYWMFALVQNANYGFWFFCAWFPLLLGILLVALTAGGVNARWLYVNVDQQEGEWPQHITFGLPVPLGVVSWFLRTFGHFIRGMDKANVDGILSAISAVDGLDEPLIVNVDEGDGGERVQIYIG
jgi:hypothetical protein